MTKPHYEKVTKRVQYTNEAREKRVEWMRQRGWEYVGADLDLGDGTKEPQKILLHFRRVQVAGK